MPDLKPADHKKDPSNLPEDILLPFTQELPKLFLRDAGPEGTPARDARLRILREFLSFNNTGERLVGGAPFVSSDLEVLCRHHGCPCDAPLLQALAHWGESLLSRTREFQREQPDAQPRAIGLVTKELLRRPILTATDYALFNSLTQQFLNVAPLFDRRNPEYFRYEVIRDLRASFSWVHNVMTNLGTRETDPRLREGAFLLFQETGPLLEMAIFKKMNLAILLRKNQTGFQDANRSCLSFFEKLLLQLEQTIGPSGVPLLKQARTVFACEYWSGVTILDLIIKRLVLMRPDLRDPLKTLFVEWKNSIFEMQNRQYKVRDLLSPKGGDIVLTSDITEEILVSVGVFTDLMGALELTQDLLQFVQNSNFSDRFLAQLLSFLLTTLLPGIKKYECFGQGEYNNMEKSIQQKTLNMAASLQRILKMGERSPALFSPPVFWGSVFVYHKQLVIVFGEKNREYLKPSEKEILADSPGTPNRYYLFERKPLAAASPFKSPLIPVAKAWNPFFLAYHFELDEVMPLVTAEESVVLEPLEQLLRRTASA